MRQQFHRGDLVRTHDTLWNGGGVRDQACWAIIVGSYRDQYGGGESDRHTYTILVLDGEGQPLGQESWWDDHEIDFLVQERCLETLDVIDFYEEEDDEDDGLL